MLKYIKTYFILVLYILFTIGIIVENHSACDSCDSGMCDIEQSSSENGHDCHNSSCEISHTENTDHHCGCTSEEYKIDNNYVNEYKLRVLSNIDFSFNILFAILDSEILLNQTTQEHSFYLKIPDKKLFHKLNIYELSSILC